MSKINIILKITWDNLRLNMLSPKFWMGIIAGCGLTLRYTMQFLRFSAKIGQPVNILEPFFYVCNDFKSSMFLVLGLFLIISDVPFIRARTLQLICRTTRRDWNVSVMLHITVLTCIYYGILLLCTIILSLYNGYVGNGWSVPMTEIATQNQLAMSRYNLAFGYYEYMMEHGIVLSVVKSYIGVVLYGILEAFIVYVFNMGRIWPLGTGVAVMVHFVSYVAYVEEFKIFSLLTYSICAECKSYMVFLLLYAILYMAAYIRCRNVDYHCISEG